MTSDEDQILFREILPKSVFDGNSVNRSSIVNTQWGIRVAGVLCLLGAIWVADTTISEHLPWDLRSYFDVVLVLIGALLLFIYSEILLQSPLDGNVRLVISGNRISIPPRMKRKMMGDPNYVLKKDVERVVIKRGRGFQFIEKGGGVMWRWVPIEIIIVTTKGRKYRSGPKPPNTIIGAVEVLRNSWGVPIDIPGFGMGTGVICANGRMGNEFSYEEIIKMDLFEWEE